MKDISKAVKTFGKESGLYEIKRIEQFCRVGEDTYPYDVFLENDSRLIAKGSEEECFLPEDAKIYIVKNGVERKVYLVEDI